MTREEIVQALQAVINLAARGTYNVDFQGSQQMQAIVTRAGAAVKELAEEGQEDNAKEEA